MGKKSPLVRKKDHGIYQEAAKRYSLGETKKIIARIGEYDLSTRKIGTDMHSLLIEQLLMTIMVHKGSRSNPIQYLSFTTDAMI